MVVNVNNDISIKCGKLMLYYFVTNFLDQQPAKIFLDRCTINEDIGKKCKRSSRGPTT